MLKRNLLATLAMTIAALSSAHCAHALDVAISTDRNEIEMGRSVAVEAVVKTAEGGPAAGCMVLSYVNGKRWGSHEVTDAEGRVHLYLPLPNPGQARIQAEAIDRKAAAQWVWSGESREGQELWLCKEFSISGTPTQAELRLAVDDSCEVFLNGQSVAKASGWSGDGLFSGLAGHLHDGKNRIVVKASNGTGPAGFLAELTIRTGDETLIRTDGSWKCGPSETEANTENVDNLGAVHEGAWSSPALTNWPGAISRDLLFAGRPMPGNAIISNVAEVNVLPRRLEVHEDPDHLMGMQWEPWFTPLNAYWQTAQATPVIGYYDSYDPDVMRQHALWLIDAGINFIFVDWSNHIWGKQHWDERGPGPDEIIRATTLTLEEYAKMRTEGLPVPKVVIMPGLSNGPPTTMEALNEQIEWIRLNYVEDPRFEGLWVEYEGKPLVVPLDCAYLAVKEETPPVDDTHFTVRWMGTQAQLTKCNEKGYWSWMDGCLYPLVTYHNGKPEVVTPTPAYFADEGWLGPKARGRRGGTTYIESFKPAIEHRPKFILLHQWNEYAGQPKGQGYGPNRDRYVDSYSVELSDDLEPVSMTCDGYRDDTGGWGYYYLNLTQALVRLFHQEQPIDTVMAVHPPERDASITTDSLDIEWAVIGRQPEGYSVLLDDKPVAEGLAETSFRLDLTSVSDGPHELTVSAIGATTRFALSRTEMDVPLESGQPTQVRVPFVVNRQQ